MSYVLRVFVREVIKKCKRSDAKDGENVCLYTKDGKHLLGRHKTKKDAYDQEYAIKQHK